MRHVRSVSLLLSFVILFLCFSASRSFADQDTAKLKELTDALISISVQPSRSQSAVQALDLAQQREQVLLKIIGKSPHQAFELLLPSDVVARLPLEARPHAECDADESGELEILVEDYADGTHRMRYFLKTASERLEMYFVTDPPLKFKTGDHVRVHGKRLDSIFVLPSTAEALTSDTIAPLQTQTLTTSNTFGEQSTVGLLINFTGNPAEPTTVEAAREMVFTTVSNFDRENSQDQTWLTGDVFGWFTVPLDGVTCLHNSVATLGEQAATAAGVNLANYHRIVYMFPTIPQCGWLGLGTIGGDPSRAWIDGLVTDPMVAAHEMGHNFGLLHSHTAEDEYGDLFDTMARWTNGHYNAFQKERLGWLNYGSSNPITTVTASGTYSITPAVESGYSLRPASNPIN